jgi:hypothetical protein
MGLKDLFSKDKEKTEQETPATELPPCPHGVLLPRWDSIDDIGHEDRATAYFCEACHETFTPEQAQRLRESAHERLPVESATES